LTLQAGGEQSELVAVSEEGTGTVQTATVYVPGGNKGYFLDRPSKYVETENFVKAKNAPVIEGTESTESRLR
jgi:hypothetical protein